MKTIMKTITDKDLYVNKVKRSVSELKDLADNTKSEKHGDEITLMDAMGYHNVKDGIATMFETIVHNLKQDDAQYVELASAYLEGVLEALEDFTNILQKEIFD